MHVKQISLLGVTQHFGQDTNMNFQHTYTPWRSTGAAFSSSVTAEAAVDADVWGRNMDVW